jgi:hypothetical protein
LRAEAREQSRVDESLDDLDPAAELVALVVLRAGSRVELVPRRKRSLGPGDPRWLLRVVRVRETKKKRKHR